MSGGSAAAVLQYTGICAFVSVVLLGLIYFGRSISTARRRRGDADGTEQDAVTARTGLAAADVAVLPRFTYHAASPGRGGDKAKAAMAADCCAVCLDELHEGELVRMLRSCRHYFHASCVDVWLRSHATCPVCRASPSSEKVRLGEASLSPPVPQLRRCEAAPKGGDRERDDGTSERTSSFETIIVPSEVAGAF